MKRGAVVAFVLLIGCAKRIAVTPPQPTSCSTLPGYAYCAEPGEWVVLSKTGPHDKELCPHGAICTTEVLGTMYRIRRTH